MKLPENYESLTCVLLSHIEKEPAPHTNVMLRDKLTDKIKSEEIGDLIAYALKQNFIYVNFSEGILAYELTSRAHLYLRKNSGN
ncbi:hypothetical protein [Adhaeribacter aquaticus]|uniref:hypothetical protein n=1 Tax=Adhaeribacter aquaticus TaxID=299567 RepID=UPI0003F896A3|nr:hypothetical protein [Adhaeribacter aquaticus]